MMMVKFGCLFIKENPQQNCCGRYGRASDMIGDEKELGNADAAGDAVRIVEIDSDRTEFLSAGIVVVESPPMIVADDLAGLIIPAAAAVISPAVAPLGLRPILADEFVFDVSPHAGHADPLAVGPV